MFPSDKFLKSFDDQEVVLTVTPLAASNRWMANVSRWTGQVSMDKSPEEIEAMTVEVEVDEIASKKIRLLPGKDDSLAIKFDDYVKTIKLP